ncbi:phosphotransferase [Candidatus Magnetomorum sp. HK-1]|nr:phosphotransferase [Candidatus Magnetomorum sp. HK-1]
MQRLWQKFQENMEYQLSFYEQLKSEVIDMVGKLYDFQPKDTKFSTNAIDSLSFAEKASLFSHEFLVTFVHIHQFSNKHDIFTKKLYARLISTSHLLEDFLDFHGAKSNKEWYYYRELAATVRHLSLAGCSQKHISNRIDQYHIEKPESFEQDGLLNHQFITQTLVNLSETILSEADRLGMKVPEKLDWEYYPRLSANDQLEFDIDEEFEGLDKKELRKNYVKIANDYLNIAKEFEQHAFFEPYTMKKLKATVPEKINEVEIRRYEMVVHNLQSYFDSYVVYGRGSAYDLKLKKLRAAISIPLHLLKMMGRMLHFYERHIIDAGNKDVYKQVKSKLGTLVNSEELLDRTINYGLFYVCTFLISGKEWAVEILNENINQGTVKVPVPQPKGFHMRPSLLVAKIVEHYGGKVTLCVGDRKFDAGSVLEIQWAGGKIHKEEITEVTFTGDARALQDIERLAKVNYCEDTFGTTELHFPKEISYLR